ncbi:MAG: hypothetical protein PSV18_14655, partial [Methylobacter sp.]|nr:hypothetical protein [Candidatus Methylobacter titanis]
NCQALKLKTQVSALGFFLPEIFAYLLPNYFSSPLKPIYFRSYIKLYSGIALSDAVYAQINFLQ